MLLAEPIASSSLLQLGTGGSRLIAPSTFGPNRGPKSPDKHREDMRLQLAAVAEEQAAMGRAILRLMASSAQVKAERWDNARRLALEVVERCFNVASDVDLAKVEVVRQRAWEDGEKGVYVYRRSGN